MAVRNIVTIPDKVLREKAKKVTDFGPKFQQLVQDLKDTVLAASEPEGAGLAAPQLGTSKSVCIVRRFFRDPNDENVVLSKEYVLVNPKIISSSNDTYVEYEGCLSVPDTYGQVERFKKVKIRAQNEKGEPIRLTGSGFFGRTMQHEIDHLNGVLFVDRLIGDTVTEEELEQIVNKEKESTAQGSSEEL